jgi:hypothetical protein
MPKQKGIVGKKEQKLRGEYADYLRGEKWGGKEAHKKAKSYYNWKQDKLKPKAKAKAKDQVHSMARRRKVQSETLKRALE